MKLYEITEAYNNLEEIEEVEEREKYLNLIEDGFEEKAENIVKFIKNLEADAKALKDEEKRLAEKRKAKENSIKWFKFYLQNNMEMLDKKKIKAGLFNVNIQKNPPSVNVINEKMIDDEYFIIERKLDKQKLKADLKDGKEIMGAELQQGESLRIRWVKKNLY